MGSLDGLLRRAKRIERRSRGVTELPRFRLVESDPEAGRYLWRSNHRRPSAREPRSVRFSLDIGEHVPSGYDEQTDETEVR